MANSPSMKNQEIAKGICEEFARMQDGRLNFESHWEEIAERMIPAHKQAFNAFGQFQSPGEKRTEFLFDSTASVALNRFSAILDSLLTPRNQTWHRLMASEPSLNKDRETRLWFEEATRILFKYRYAPMANFASQNQQNYKSLGAYGTGCMYIDRLSTDVGIRYRNVHLSEIYFSENHQGIVDKAIRHYPLTYRQALQKFGKDNLPKRVVEQVEKKPNDLLFFLHCVKPREDIKHGNVDYLGMPFASYDVLMGADSQVVSEGGFETFPYAISRYEQHPGEIYGRSPAMDVLPAVKTLNEQKKTLLKQGHRAVDPVLLAHDDGIVDSFSLRPGAINAGGVSADGRPLVHAIPTGNVSIGKDLMDDERAVINDAFLITIFQILTESPQMTATEVMERTREKGILLAPTIGRQQSEYLGPLIDRELDLLTQMRLLPPMPPALLEAQGEYRVEYDSPLSRAQKAEEAAGLMRTIESALQVVNVTQNPAPLDHFNWDVIIPEVSEIQGVPSKWMRSMEEVQEIRQARAEEAQEQTAIQAAPAAASMLKVVGGKG